MLAGNPPVENISQIVAIAAPKIFDFDFPIFDETYRGLLERKILMHYYTREICAETVGLFKHFLNVRMNDIMPYYNQLYKSQLIEFNPMYDSEHWRDYSNKKDGVSKAVENSVENDDDTTTAKDTLVRHNNSNNNSTQVGNNWDLHSDTPQGGLSNVSDMKYLSDATNNQVDNKYNENASDDENATRDYSQSIMRDRKKDNTRDITINDITQYTEHVRGKLGASSYSKLLQEFRETFLNIDLMIIDELSDLFYGLYGGFNDDKLQCW